VRVCVSVCECVFVCEMKRTKDQTIGGRGESVRECVCVFLCV